MNTNTLPNSTTPVLINSSSANLAAAFLFGAIMFLAVGFLPAAEVHNAAHDTRHTAAFPCH